MSEHPDQPLAGEQDSQEADSSGCETESSCEFVVVDSNAVSYHHSLDCYHGAEAAEIGLSSSDDSPFSQESEERQRHGDMEDADDSESEFTEHPPEASGGQTEQLLLIEGEESEDLGRKSKPAGIQSEDFAILSESDIEVFGPVVPSLPVSEEKEKVAAPTEPLVSFPSHLLLRQYSESSDSDHSDFVRLERERTHPSLRLSICSTSSSNSLLMLPDSSSYPHDYARVRAAHRAQLEPRYHYIDDDNDSLPSDIDDRCESDISGIAIDTSDMSTLSIGELPLTAGNVVRSYKHRPNVSLNTALTYVTLVSLFLAVGIGIGHFIGSVQEGKLRSLQVANLHGIQDDYMICLQRQQKLEARVRAPSAKEEQLSTEMKLWQQLYEQVVVEKSQLEHQIQMLEVQMEADLHQANQQLSSHQSEVALIGVDLENLANKLPVTSDVGVNDLSEAEPDSGSDDSMNALKLDQYHTEYPQTDGQSLTGTQELEDNIQRLTCENEELKVRIGKVLYSRHPANQDEAVQSSGDHDQGHIISDGISQQQQQRQQRQQQQQVRLRLARTRHLLTVEKQVSHFWHQMFLNHSTQNMSLSTCFKMLMSADNFKDPGLMDHLASTVIKQWENLKVILTKGPLLMALREKFSKLETDSPRSKLPEHFGDFEDFDYSQNSSDNSSSKNQVLSHIESFINNSRQKVLNLTQKVHVSFNKVQNMSANLEVKKYRDAVLTEVSQFGNSMVDGWKKFVSSIRNNLWQPKEKEKQKPKSDHTGGRSRKASQPDREDNHRYVHLKETVHGKKDYLTQGKSTGTPPTDSTKKGSFEQKPVHKQSSNHDYDYNEFWKMADYQPDDILLHGGFFEENNHEWKKQQKRFRKLHGRLQRLNEEMLLTMDEDDVEDLYDDLDDLEDDLEEVEIPERLMTWLTCQIRWWKSRLHRKHRTENLVKGCGRHLMKWQIKALCMAQCPLWEKHCKDWLSLSDKLTTLCQGLSGFYTNTQSDSHPHPSFFLDGYGDSDLNGVKTKESQSMSSASWYFAREAGDFDATWYNERMLQREDSRHNPAWYFRGLERETPDARWQFGRARNRQSVRTTKK